MTSSKTLLKSFERLKTTALSPFLHYEYVQELLLCHKSFRGKHSYESIISNSHKNDGQISKLDQLNVDSSETNINVFLEGRDLKRQKSLKVETVIEVPVRRGKMDCLSDILHFLQMRYEDLISARDVLNEIARECLPDPNSPTFSPMKGINGGDMRSALSVDPVDASSSLMEDNLGKTRNEPMIPLSVAGAAKLFSKSDVISASKESSIDIDAALVVGKSVVSITNNGGKSLKRTNSIVNVHRTSFSQRTGRRGKSVKANLKPDPNVNSILSFTVPQGVPSSKGGSSAWALNLGNQIRAPLQGSSTSSSSENASITLLGESSSSFDDSNSRSVRRSARKKPRNECSLEEGSLGSFFTQPDTRFDFRDIDDTPVEKLRNRREKGTGHKRGMKSLEGAGKNIYMRIPMYGYFYLFIHIHTNKYLYVYMYV